MTIFLLELSLSSIFADCVIVENFVVVFLTNIFGLSHSKPHWTDEE